MVKEYACNAGHPGLIPGSGRSPGEGNGYPLQYSYLENFMDREVWWATESDTTEWLTPSLSSTTANGPGPGSQSFSKWVQTPRYWLTITLLPSFQPCFLVLGSPFFSLGDSPHLSHRQACRDADKAPWGLVDSSLRAQQLISGELWNHP